MLHRNFLLMHFTLLKPTALWAAVIVCLSVLVATIGIPSIVYSLTPYKPAALVAAFAVALPVSSWSVRAMRRFCGRLVPLSASGRRMLAPEVACTAVCVIAAIAILDSIERLFVLADVAAWFETGGIFLIIAATCFIAFGLQARQYFRPSAIEPPYILYLRTFLGFSDHALTAALFTIAGGRHRIVVFTPPHSSAASWDPVLIAFRGNPVLQLRVESPIFLRAADREWENAVNILVKRASHVVVDISDMSTGIRAELEIVRRAGTATKVIWMIEAAQADRMQQIRALVGNAHMPPSAFSFTDAVGMRPYPTC